jgi:hypothetical protein
MAASTTTKLVVSAASQGGEAPFDAALADILAGASNATAALALLAAGVAPPTMVTQFGAGAGVLYEAGRLIRQVSSAGVNPGATGADNVLAVATIPAASFDIAGRAIWISANGSVGSNSNNKTIKLIVNPSTAVVGSTVGSGGTTVCSTGVVTANGTGWQIEGTIIKYGAAGSNTQICFHNQAQVGTTLGSVLAPSLMTATESAGILVAITGNAGSLVGDITFNWLEIDASN